MEPDRMSPPRRRPGGPTALFWCVVTGVVIVVPWTGAWQCSNRMTTSPGLRPLVTAPVPQGHVVASFIDLHRDYDVIEIAFPDGSRCFVAERGYTPALTCPPTGGAR